MRDWFYRSIAVHVADEIQPAAEWPIELTNALLCYFTLAEIVASLFNNVAPTKAEENHVSPTGAIKELLRHSPELQHETKIALDISKSIPEREDAAKNCLRAYLLKRDMFSEWGSIPQPNIHVSHLELLNEYIKGIYAIHDDTLQVFRYELPNKAVMGQVTVFGYVDGYLMQGIITCPFFSTFKKNKRINLSIADKLVEKVKEHDIHPRVLPIATNEVWKDRVEEYANKNMLVFLDDSEIASVVSEFSDS